MKTRVNILMSLLTLAVFVALATGCALAPVVNVCESFVDRAKREALSKNEYCVVSTGKTGWIVRGTRI